jgi:hypothetical protein
MKSSSLPDNNGRVGKMVNWLRQNQAEIEQPEQVQIAFSCRGRSVWAELATKDRIETGPLGKLKSK